MVKKINKNPITIKNLLKNGKKQYKIAKLLNLKRVKVNYWSKVKIKERQFKKKKINAYIHEKSKKYRFCI